MSMPGSWSRSSTFRSDRGNRTYIMTVRRMTSGLVLKSRNGLDFVIPRSYEIPPPASRQFLLTEPAPPYPAEVPPDQRHGRTFQRAHRGRLAKPPLPIRQGAGNHAAPLCLALQPAASAISLGQQAALAGDEGLAQTQTGAVQKQPYYLPGCDR